MFFKKERKENHELFSLLITMTPKIFHTNITNNKMVIPLSVDTAQTDY